MDDQTIGRTSWYDRWWFCLAASDLWLLVRWWRETQVEEIPEISTSPPTPCIKRESLLRGYWPAIRRLCNCINVMFWMPKWQWRLLASCAVGISLLLLSIGAWVSLLAAMAVGVCCDDHGCIGCSESVKCAVVRSWWESLHIGINIEFSTWYIRIVRESMT